MAGHRHPYMWPFRGHSHVFLRPSGLRKAQPYCTTVSIAYTPLQHTATVTLATMQQFISPSVHNVSVASSLGVSVIHAGVTRIWFVIRGDLEQVLSHGSDTE